MSIAPEIPLCLSASHGRCENYFEIEKRESSSPGRFGCLEGTIGSEVKVRVRKPD
jgi:hypothetical protein